MTKPLRLCNLINALWHGYSDDVGKALIHLGATGWFFSALAQIGMIATNENIDKKEKKFLIPQEISDGLINVTLYYTICQGIKHTGEYVLEKGKLLTKDTADFIKKIYPVPNKNLSIVVEELADIYQNTKLINAKTPNSLTDVINGTMNYFKGENVGAISALNSLYPDLVRKINDNFGHLNNEQNVNTVKNLLKNYNKFKNGIGVLMAVSASILACNMITPVCRNISANYFQKKLMRQKQIDKLMAYNENNFYRVSLPSTFNNFKI